MGPENGINLNKFSYFPIEEYIDKIKIEDSLLYHLEDTNNKFETYIKYLSLYDDYEIIYHWIISLFNEITSSQKLESHSINPNDVLKNDVFFDSLQISHARIKKLHNFAIGDLNQENQEGYRKNEVWIRRINHGKDEVVWYGAKSEDVKRFMDDFIEFYKKNSIKAIYSNPFLKSAMVHLLFVRIHPFSDGNGRTARLIHNIKFTQSINNIYGTDLKISPLNISQNILLNKITYVNRLNDIYFDLEHDSNHEINRWLDFVLDMVDEQIYYSMDKINWIEDRLDLNTLNTVDVEEAKKRVKSMKLMRMGL